MTDIKEKLEYLGTRELIHITQQFAADFYPKISEGFDSGQTINAGLLNNDELREMIASFAGSSETAQLKTLDWIRESEEFVQQQTTVALDGNTAMVVIQGMLLLHHFLMSRDNIKRSLPFRKKVEIQQSDIHNEAAIKDLIRNAIQNGLLAESLLVGLHGLGAEVRPEIESFQQRLQKIDSPHSEKGRIQKESIYKEYLELLRR